LQERLLVLWLLGRLKLSLALSQEPVDAVNDHGIVCATLRPEIARGTRHGGIIFQKPAMGREQGAFEDDLCLTALRSRRSSWRK